MRYMILMETEHPALPDPVFACTIGDCLLPGPEQIQILRTATDRLIDQRGLVLEGPIKETFWRKPIPKGRSPDDVVHDRAFMDRSTFTFFYPQEA